MLPPSLPIGTRDMLSTPPPITRSCWPDITPIAAKFTAWAPDPQNRFRLTPVTSSGHSAARTELRAMHAPWSLTCITHPTTTSSTSFFSIPVFVAT